MWWAIAQWDDQPGAAGAVRDRDVSRRDVPVLADLARAAAARVPRAAAPSGPVAAALACSIWRSCMVPLLAIFLVHSWNRWGWMVIVRTSGAVLHPSLDSLGWLLPLLALAGIVVAASDRRARVTIVLLMVIALQARHAVRDRESAGRGHAVHGVQDGVSRDLSAGDPRRIRAGGEWGLRVKVRVASQARIEPIGWLIAAVLLVVAVRPALTAPRPIPVVDLDLNAAGQWLRVERRRGVLRTTSSPMPRRRIGCTWPCSAIRDRRSACASSIATTRGRRWRRGSQPKGEAYAIADLRLLPDEVRSRVQIVQRVWKCGGDIRGRVLQ